MRAATTAITLDIYSPATPTMGADAAEKVAGLIFGQFSGRVRDVPRARFDVLVEPVRQFDPQPAFVAIRPPWSRGVSARRSISATN
jgi:hypothetical protein